MVCTYRVEMPKNESDNENEYGNEKLGQTPWRFELLRLHQLGRLNLTGLFDQLNLCLLGQLGQLVQLGQLGHLGHLGLLGHQQWQWRWQWQWQWQSCLLGHVPGQLGQLGQLGQPNQLGLLGQPSICQPRICDLDLGLNV